MELNVLIIDDDFINRKLLYTYLKKYNSLIMIEEAENGSDALSKLKYNPDINLILLDIVMPVVDGIEFLKIFRSDMVNAHIPIIVLSTDDSKKTTVFECGANDFIRKPIKSNELIEKIQQWS